MAQAHAKGMVPERFVGKPEMVFSAMQLAYELGLKPLTALRQIAVIKGTPSLFGDLPLSLCYASGRLRSIKEVWLDKNLKEISLENGNLNSEVFAAHCKVFREGDPEPAIGYFTMAEAQAAGLLNSPTWKSYPKRMLRYRARSQALKDKFPDALNGISIAEYDHNETEETILVNNGSLGNPAPSKGLGNIIDAEVTNDSIPTDSPSEADRTDNADNPGRPVPGVEPSPEGGGSAQLGQGSADQDGNRVLSDNATKRAVPGKRTLGDQLRAFGPDGSDIS